MDVDKLFDFLLDLKLLKSIGPALLIRALIKGLWKLRLAALFLLWMLFCFIQLARSSEQQKLDSTILCPNHKDIQ